MIEAGGQALAIPADVADHTQVEKAATEIEAQFGPIDVWINVAFTSVFAPFAEIAPDEFRRVTEVSYLGYVNGTMVALSRMRPRNAGTIVQVGSALSERADPAPVGLLRRQARDQRVHRVAALRAPARALERPRDRGADAGGQHTTVLLGAVPAAAPPPAGATDLPAGGRRARRRVRGRSSGAQRYWVGGSTAATLLAQKLAPAILDRYLARTGFDAQQHRPGRAGGRAAGQPVRPGRRGRGRTTTARTGSSTTGPTARSWRLLASHHPAAWPAVWRPAALAGSLLVRRLTAR